MLAALGTLIGFSLFSLGTTYVLGVYRVLERMNILEMSIYHQAEESDKPLSVLECHFPGGEARDLGFLLRDFHQGIEAYYNGILRYPVVYFFYSRRLYRSAPFAFRTIGYVAAGLKWGLPESHPATREPALHPLVIGFDLTTTQIKDRIAISNENTPPEPADFAAFSAALAGEKEPEKEPEDCGLGRFVEAERFMRRLARVEEVPEPEEAYDRYKQWLLFIHRVDSFVELLAEDLGYDLDALRDRPAKSFSG